MRVLIITQYFPPEIGAAASRWGDYTNILANKGHDVTVICEMPNYPNGKYYNGYKNTWSRKEKDTKNLTIYRTTAFATDRKSKINKLLHYFTFMISGMIQSIKLKKFDIVIVSSPPLFVGIIGVFYKIIKSDKYWIDVRDLWPDSVIALGQIKKGIFYNFAKKLEYLIYKSAKGFILTVPDFKNYINTNYSELKKPMFTLINGVSNDYINQAELINIAPEKRFTVLYSGNLGLAQSLEVVILVAQSLENLQINFRLIGSGVRAKSLKDLVKKKKLSNVFFHESMPRNELIQWIKKSSICLAPLMNEPLFNNAIPSKIFEYMACKRPIICNHGSAGKIINEINAGRAIEAENVNQLSSTIKFYFYNQQKIDIHGLAGFNYVKNNMVKENLMDELLSNIIK